MKKLLAIALALSMALSCCVAFADEAPMYASMQATITVDGQMIQMLTGGGNAMVDAVVSMLNKLAITIEDGDGQNGRLAVTAGGGNVVSLNFAMAEDGSVLLTSELFPSYALSISAEMMATILQPFTAAVSADQTPVADLSGITALIQDKTTELVPGEYTINGKSYAASASLHIDGEMMNAVIGQMVTLLKVDLSKLGQIPDFTEQGIEFDVVYYYAADGKTLAADIWLIKDGEGVSNILAEIAASEEGNATVNAFIPASLEYETWDAAIAALNAGEDLGYALTAEIGTAGISFVIYNGGQYLFGLSLGVTGTDLKFVVTMASPEMPLITVDLKVTTASTTSVTPMDITGLTVLDIAAMNDPNADNAEVTEAFTNDISYGASMIMVNLMQLLPDEMTVIMNAITPQQVEVTTDSTEVPAA